MPVVHFPVLKRLSISDYQLFPGKDGRGLDHDFIPGVTVAVGVNGLGKTTLLNMILRSLIGFNAPTKFDPYDPGAGSHRMVEQYEEAGYFSSRTSNLARTARLTTEFTFGKKSVQIIRALDTMMIVKLVIDGTEVSGSQHELQHAIVAASGLTNLYDFFYIVFSFTFFLEEKVSLIWNPKGQFEIFRILFFEADKASDVARLGEKIKKNDSTYRNRRHHYNRACEDLATLTKRSDDNSVLAEDLRLKRVDVNTLEETDERLSRKLEQAITKRSGLLERVTKLRLELEEYRRHQEGLLNTFFSRAFPDLPDVVANVLNHLTAGHGCIVCGTQNPQNHGRYRDLAKKGICPFCETSNVRTEKTGVLTERTEAEIAKVEKQITEVRRSILTLEGELTAIAGNIDELQTERLANGSKLIAARGEVARLEAALPLTADQLGESQSKLDSEARELKRLKKEIEDDTEKYARLLRQGKKAVEAMASMLTKRFAYYAGEFLAEKCVLSYQEEKRRLGQEGELLDFPNFQIEMTSAVSPTVRTARTDQTQVSESQKEFIDLAFRMALFDAVRQPKEGVMLVIETPEASLDSIFVKKAGALLRRFAEEDSGQPNVIIASCNLNSAGMVRSLLGVEDLTKKEAAVLVPKRLINLLDVALPNAAVRANATQYRRELADAINR